MTTTNNKTMKKQITRPATESDMKIGTTVMSGGYEFVIIKESQPGVWEARGVMGQGCKCIFTHINLLVVE